MSRHLANQEEILLQEQDRLYELREAHLQTLQHDFEIINDDDRFYALSLEDLQICETRMQETFRAMEEAHHQYRQRAMLATNHILKSAEAELLVAFAKLQRRIQVLTSISRNAVRSPQLQSTFGQFAASAMANSTINPDGQAVIRVEQPHRPQIGKFNGNMADWPAFRDLFIAEVHNRPIDAVRKLLLLKDACVGKAADTLGAWGPTAENYLLAWESMMAIYDDKYHIIHGILAKLNATSKQDEETHDALRSILDSLTSCTRQLESMATLDVLINQIWINHAKQRLPHQTLDAWEQHRNTTSSGQLPTLIDFKKFLDSRAKARREFENQSTLVRHDGSQKIKHEPKYALAQSRPKPYDKHTKSRPATEASTDRPGFGPPTQCIMPGCTQLHYLGQCRMFAPLPLKDKLKLVQEKALCHCCLAAGHRAVQCQRLTCSRCPNERQKHHFRLCPKATDAKPSSTPDVKSNAA